MGLLPCCPPLAWILNREGSRAFAWGHGCCHNPRAPAQPAELLQVYSLAASLLKHLDRDLMTLSFPRFFQFLSDQRVCPLPKALCVPSAGLGHVLLPPMPTHQSHRRPALLLREAGRMCCQPEGVRSSHATVPRGPPCDPQSSELPCVSPCISQDPREGYPDVL